jgi:hypothetical protein
MKVRNGFVSNSSSSSFIFARHPDFPSAEDIFKLHYMPEHDGNPWAPIFNPIIKHFASALENEEMDLEEWYGPRGEEECMNKWWELKDAGWKIFTGSFSDEDGAMDAMLCDLDMHIDNPMYKLEKDGGY